MTQTRKQYGPKFKAKVALEAIKGHRTLNEIAAAYSVHPTIVQKWKKQVLDLLPELFADGRSRSAQTDEQLQAQLYQATRPAQSRTRLVENKSWTAQLMISGC